MFGINLSHHDISFLENQVGYVRLVLGWDVTETKSRTEDLIVDLYTAHNSEVHPHAYA